MTRTFRIPIARNFPISSILKGCSASCGLLHRVFAGPSLDCRRTFFSGYFGAKYCAAFGEPQKKKTCRPSRQKSQQDRQKCAICGNQSNNADFVRRNCREMYVGVLCVHVWSAVPEGMRVGRFIARNEKYRLTASDYTTQPNKETRCPILDGMAFLQIPRLSSDYAHMEVYRLQYFRRVCIGVYACVRAFVLCKCYLLIAIPRRHCHRATSPINHRPSLHLA